jgi:recombination protein RecR
VMSRQDPVAKLIYEFSKLPGIGEKSATRLAYFILKQNEDVAQGLAQALIEAKQKVGLCKSCFTFTDSDQCPICENPARKHEVVCVVERPSDVHSIEISGSFAGLYHVLHGVLSPLDGIGPEELKIRELLMRLKDAEIREIIIATNPSVEGQATALYLARILKPLGLKVTQLAYGIPLGGQLEYTDRQTIGKALENRMEIA